MQLGPKDALLSQREKKLATRKIKHEEYCNTSVSQACELVLPPSSSPSYSYSSSDDNDDDYNGNDATVRSATYQPPIRSKATSVEDDGFIHLSLPRKDLLSKSAEVATRCGISHRQQVALTAKLVKIGGGNLADTSLSVATSFRQRKTATKSSADNIKREFVEHMPKYLVLHWDSKVIKYAHHHKSDDRLAIIVSKPGSGDPPQRDQFLAAPCIRNSTGQVMADALDATLQQWEIPRERIIGTCWDTTASNTGRRLGAATLFDCQTDQACLWLACRHHVGELHIKHADETRGVSNGPTDSLFEKFRDEFETLPKDNLKLWEGVHDNQQPMTWLRHQANEVLIWGEQELLAGTFPREDYRELLELTVHYLGGDVVRPRVNAPPIIGFTMRHPGALHHARFMSKGLYILKIAMLIDVLPRKVLPHNKKSGIVRIAQFISLFYTRYFLTARLAAAAPNSDLTLWKLMCLYNVYDRRVASAVKLSIKNHLWYFTEQLVVLSLFDKSVGDDVKAAISAALQACVRPVVYPVGKPTFPENILVRADASPELSSFVGHNSYLMFDLLGIDSGWLNVPPPLWEANQQYQCMAEVVKSLSVVNDTAERCVKAVQDFANAAQDGTYRDEIILVSNSHRMKIPSFLKNEMEENI